MDLSGLSPTERQVFGRLSDSVRRDLAKLPGGVVVQVLRFPLCVSQSSLLRDSPAQSPLVGRFKRLWGDQVLFGNVTFLAGIGAMTVGISVGLLAAIWVAAPLVVLGLLGALLGIITADRKLPSTPVRVFRRDVSKSDRLLLEWAVLAQQEAARSADPDLVRRGVHEAIGLIYNRSGLVDIPLAERTDVESRALSAVEERLAVVMRSVNDSIVEAAPKTSEDLPDAETTSTPTVRRVNAERVLAEQEAVREVTRLKE